MAQEATKTRHHTPNQLVTRPLTVKTCGGELQIVGVQDGKRIKIRVIHPATIPVTQPPGVEKPVDATPPTAIDCQ